MKKLTLLALSSMLALGASATDYVVWSGAALADDEVQIPVAGWYEWWNCEQQAVDDADAVGGKALQFTNRGLYDNTSFSYGLHFQNSEFQLSQVVAEDMDLTFNVKSTDANATYSARVTGAGDCDFSLVFDHDGEWHPMRCHLSDYPALVEAWKQNPTDVVVFSVVADNTTAGSGSVLVSDIRYTPTDHSNDAQWEAGKVWYGYEEGTYTCDNNEFPYTFLYTITTNADQTLTIKANYTGDLDENGFAADRSIVISDVWNRLVKQDDGSWVFTTTDTYDVNKTLKMFFYVGFRGNALRTDLTYVTCSENDPIVPISKPSIVASADNITADGATINYTVTLPEALAEAAVKVLCNDEEITENPYVITGLEKATSYTYTLKAVATLDEVEYESNSVEVSFKTLNPDAKAATWYAISDGYIQNAYLPGEDDQTDRRNLPISIESAVTYNADQTITVNATLHGDGAKVVGLVPKITISSSDYKTEYKDMVNEGNNQYSLTTETLYPADHQIGWLYYYMAYAGGASSINVNGYTTGLESEPVSYGEATSIELVLSTESFSVDSSAFVQAIVKDQNGHYMLDVTPEITVDGSAFSLQDNKVVAQSIGEAVVKATYNGLSAEVTVVCVTTSNASRLTDLDDVEYASDYTGSLDAAFDGNEDTQIEWSCAETEEHYITVNLGKLCSVQAVTLVWEGASATEYTVTLSQKAASNGAAVNHLVSDPNAEDVVFAVTDGEGGAGVTARKMLYSENGAVAAQYVTLQTTKAYNAGWGIKLKEMNIQGLPDTTSVESVAVEDANAPVEYFNLQGVRVANPENGIYIRRQGNTTSKVVIR